MFQLSATGSYINMWTITCHYSVPTLLFLLYYYIIKKTYSKESISRKRKTVIFFLGFLCGMCHECLGAFLILMVSISTIYESCIVRKATPIKRLSLNIGLYLGYVIILLAPGNYKRLFGEHDASRLHTDIISKFQNSIEQHLLAAGVLNKFQIALVVLFGIFVIITYIKKRYSIYEWFKDNLELVSVILISVPVWALFAPVPLYGLQLWKASLIILILKACDVTLIKEWTRSVLAIAGCIVFIMMSITWIPDLTEVTTERREQIREAKENGEEVVCLERYPETTANYLTLYNYANREDVFNDIIYDKYYGIKITIEEE